MTDSAARLFWTLDFAVHHRFTPKGIASDQQQIASRASAHKMKMLIASCFDELTELHFGFAGRRPYPSKELVR
jgi:hypothetical protein